MSEMEEIAEKLALYHMLFLFCLMGTVVSLAISMSFFLRYRIWEMFGKKKRPLKRTEIAKEKHRQRPQKRENPKTVLLSFRVEREIILVHTKEEI